jgi:PPOX class probable F420-dependent enzyme
LFESGSVTLDRAKYLNLATYRRNGVEVRTPVWFAGAAPLYYLFSAGDAGKVKRIRANGQAKVVSCDARGGITGEWFEASARLVDDASEIQHAYRALRRKYGWQMRMTDVASRLAGRYAKRQMIALELAAREDDA